MRLPRPGNTGRSAPSPPENLLESPLCGNLTIAPKSSSQASDPPNEILNLLREAVANVLVSLKPDEGALEANGELFQFVADQLQIKWTAEAEHLALELYSLHHEAIARILNSAEFAARRRSQLAEARSARRQKRAASLQATEHARECLAALRSTQNGEDQDQNEEPADCDCTDIEDHENLAGEELAVHVEPDRHVAYEQELQDLLRIPWNRKNLRHFGDHPISLRLGFLLACLSRPALEMACSFLPLSSYNTIYEHFHRRLESTEIGLSDLDLIHSHIGHFRDSTDLPAGEAVSLAVDAMATTPDRAYLPSAHATYAFVFYVQPLDQRLKCWPLHVLPHLNGRATDDVVTLIDDLCDRLHHQDITVKYVCTDGDGGHNNRHLTFFRQWHPAFMAHGI
jgi:hypothetical protein